MKTILNLAFLLALSFSSFAQRPAIPMLPKMSIKEAGFNKDSINAIDDYIANYGQNDFKGMVIIKDHKIVIEYYYGQTGRTDINDVRSTGKSFTALLLGIAIEEGLVDNLEQDVYSFFPKEKYPNVHEDYKKVKIKHLLDMSSGGDSESSTCVIWTRTLLSFKKILRRIIELLEHKELVNKIRNE